MHIYFPVSGRRAGASDEPTQEQLAADAGQLMVLRDPIDRLDAIHDLLSQYEE